MSEAYLVGCSDVEVRAKLKLTEGMWDALYNDPVNSGFHEVVSFGRGMAKAWWMQQARENLKNRTFQSNLWYMVMRNQYGYSDKTTITTKEPSDLTNDELDELLAKGLEKFNKVVKKQ